MKKVLVALLLFNIVLGSFAVGQNEVDSFRVVTDHLGREVQIPFKLNKIVALEPAAISIICQLDKADIIVGIDNNTLQYKDPPVYCYANPELLSLPNVGTRKNPNLEVLLQLEPDLIITRNSIDAAEAMSAKLNIPVFVVNSLRDNDWAYFESMGIITDSSERAQELIGFYKKNQDYLTDLTESLQDNDKPSVYLGLFTESKEITKSLVSYQTVEPAGGINLTKGLTTSSSWGAIDVSKEQILEWDPDYIFIDWQYSPNCLSIEDVINDPVFQDMKAIINKNIYFTNTSHTGKDYAFLTAEMFYFLKILHPELSNEINIQRKGDEIFEFVYGIKGYYSNWLLKQNIKT